MRPGFRQEFKRARIAHKKMEKFEFEVLNFLSMGLGRLSRILKGYQQIYCNL
jgi:hypothetical protein